MSVECSGLRGFVNTIKGFVNTIKTGRRGQVTVLIGAEAAVCVQGKMRLWARQKMMQNSTAPVFRV
jgi:hypothetical protein